MTDPVDELFVGEIGEFVRHRDELVRQLKKDGDKDAAAAVKALRKPSAVAWAVNQVARRQPDAIDELVAAAEAVHAAQARAVQGKDGSSLKETTAAWRGRVRALAAEVAGVAGEQYRDDAAATFEAASTSDELSALLKAGRLVTALSPSGFGLGGMPDPPEPRREVRPAEDEAVAVPEAEAEAEPQEDPAARRRLDEREAVLVKAVHRLRRAEQRLEVAQRAVEEAAEARDVAQAARDEAAAEL